MNKIEDIISATKLNEILQKRDDDKIKKTILWTLAIVGAVVAIAGIANAYFDSHPCVFLRKKTKSNMYRDV